MFQPHALQRLDFPPVRAVLCTICTICEAKLLVYDPVRLNRPCRSLHIFMLVANAGMRNAATGESLSLGTLDWFTTLLSGI